ncbi:MAG: alcohol dehydrogenase catalytic domain-containing protein [Anaerolineae bacterium]
MLAVVKTAPGPGFELRDAPTPTPGPGQALVRVARVGICGTDLPIFSGAGPVPIPLIPGHEIGGSIVALGEGVSGWAVGERVAVSIVCNCGVCPACRLGRDSLCDAIQEIGIHVDGGFAEYVVAPAANLHRLPDAMGWAEAASVDPLACALPAVVRASIMFEDDVVVIGAGAIGLYALQLARLAGPRRLFLVGRRAQRLAVGRRWADDVIDALEEDEAAGVLARTNGRGADVVIEATGNPAAGAAALAMAAKGARVALTGIFTQPATVHLDTIVRRELNVYGTLCYTRAQFAEALRLMAIGSVDAAPIVTHVLPLSDIGLGLDLLARHEAIKVQLEPPTA